MAAPKTLEPSADSDNRKRDDSGDSRIARDECPTQCSELSDERRADCDQHLADAVAEWKAYAAQMSDVN